MGRARRSDGRHHLGLCTPTVQAETYKIYIYKVLKQVHPDTGISSKAMSIMNSFINVSGGGGTPLGRQRWRAEEPAVTSAGAAEPAGRQLCSQPCHGMLAIVPAAALYCSQLETTATSLPHRKHTLAGFKSTPRLPGASLNPLPCNSRASLAGCRISLTRLRLRRATWRATTRSPP